MMLRLASLTAPLSLPLLLVALVGCDGSSSMDGGSIDAGAPDANAVDASSIDASAPDASAPDASAPDASSVDGGPAFAGAIAGPCGRLDDELMDSNPYFFDNTLTFAMEWDESMRAGISVGGLEVLDDGNAGGSSAYSEIFAFEILHRCEGATLLKTENEIEYTPPPGALTDLLVSFDGTRIGVSVTRAVTVTGACMRQDTFTLARADELLRDKLAGVEASSARVAPADAWPKQILLILADTAEGAARLREAWEALEPSVRSDTIVYVALTEGLDEPIYFDDRCL